MSGLNGIDISRKDKKMKNDAENQKQIQDFLGGIAVGTDGIIKEYFGRELGFAILLFEFNKPGIGNYVSNAERKTMIEALRETANRLEKKEDIGVTIGGVQ